MRQTRSASQFCLRGLESRPFRKSDNHGADYMTMYAHEQLLSPSVAQQG
jgi:hypothetical protein